MLGDCGRHAAASGFIHCKDRRRPVAGQEQLFGRSVAVNRIVGNKDAASVQHKQLRDVFCKRDVDDTATVLPELLQSRKSASRSGAYRRHCLNDSRLLEVEDANPGALESRGDVPSV